MKKILVLTAFAMIFLISTSYAFEKYISVKGGYSQQEYNNEVFINNHATVSYSSGNDPQNSYIFSLATGAKFLENIPLRLELEYIRNGSADFESYWNPFLDFTQKVTVNSERLMANVYYDFDFEIIDLYSGIGLGYSINKAEASQINESISYNMPFDEDSTSNFAYSLMLGIRKKLTEKFTLDSGYRYSDAGDFQTKYSSDEQFQGKLKVHEVTIGLQYTF